MAGLRIKGYCFNKTVTDGTAAWKAIYQIKAAPNTNLRITETKVTFDDLNSAPAYVAWSLGEDTGDGSATLSPLTKITTGFPGTITATALEADWAADLTGQPSGGTTGERQYCGPGGYVELHDYVDLLAAGDTLTVWVQSADTGSDDRCAVSFKGEE
jgi:hypothetical protein